MGHPRAKWQQEYMGGEGEAEAEAGSPSSRPCVTSSVGCTVETALVTSAVAAKVDMISVISGCSTPDRVVVLAPSEGWRGGMTAEVAAGVVVVRNGRDCSVHANLRRRREGGKKEGARGHQRPSVKKTEGSQR